MLVLSKIQSMQKLVYIIMIFVVTACHKEFAQSPNANDKTLVVLAVKEVMHAEEFNQLDIHQIEAVTVNNLLIGYKIPFAENTDTQVAFVFVNVSQHQVGTIYKNEITYVPLHGGMYPSLIKNYNYSSGAIAEYQTGLNGKLPWSGTSAATIKPDVTTAAVMAIIPPVTASGVFEKQADNTETLSSIDTYILSGLLGIEALALQQVSMLQQIKSVHYFNPRAAAQKMGMSPLWMAWDLNSHK